jgi:hypothetical protein
MTEIERLQDAKRRALAIADERAKENVWLRAERDALVKALRALVDNVNDYERVNNLAPNRAHTECWDTVAEAKRILAAVSTPPGSGK